MPCNPVRHEVPFFLLVSWTALAEHSKASGTKPPLSLAHATQRWETWPYFAMRLTGKAVCAGWGTDREVGEKGWHEFPFSLATMRALWRWVTYLCPCPTLVQSTSISPSQFPLLPNMPHQESTYNIHNLCFLFQRNCKFGYICEQVTFAVCQPCWERAPLHIKQVTSTWLQRQDWSSRKSRAHKMRERNKKHKKNLPGKTLQTTSWATWALLCGTHGYKHINHDTRYWPDTQTPGGWSGRGGHITVLFLQSTSTYVLCKLH